MQFIQSTFEEVELTAQYHNIFLTHVLEHLDDPVGVLSLAHEQWLAPGVAFLLRVQMQMHHRGR